MNGFKKKEGREKKEEERGNRERLGKETRQKSFSFPSFGPHQRRCFGSIEENVLVLTGKSSERKTLLVLTKKE